MIELRTPAEIEAMKPAGRFVAEVLATLRDETRVGTNLLDIDRRRTLILGFNLSDSARTDSLHPCMCIQAMANVNVFRQN